jgi:hypothetical protein
VKSENKDLRAKLDQFEKILDPVKRENNRLIKLNNELHLELM